MMYKFLTRARNQKLKIRVYLDSTKNLNDPTMKLYTLKIYKVLDVENPEHIYSKPNKIAKKKMKSLKKNKTNFSQLKSMMQSLTTIGPSKRFKKKITAMGGNNSSTRS
jgi:hypothetical protein